jgi:hypothetical protein
LDNLNSRLPSLTTILWILASLLAFVAFLFIGPNLLNPPGPVATATGVTVGNPTPVRTETISTTQTPVPLAPPARRRTVQPLPTVRAGEQLYSFIADPTRSGYINSSDEKSHWGDRNLHAGFFGGDAYSAILFFDIGALPPNSEIVTAELSVTGLSRDNLGPQGQWRAGLLRIPSFDEWTDLTAAELLSATSTSTIGELLSPTDLDLGLANQLSFSPDQIPALAIDIQERSYLVVRLEGPTGPDNNLFTWDGGGLDLTTGAHPVLNIVARPGQFVVVTNTPTAENVVTAAAYALRQTEFAQNFGTPTAFPRSHATATPIILVTRAPTPENVETRVAIAQVATAVAFTTGTYTPTPENWIEVTATFTRIPTALVPTPTPGAIPIATVLAERALTPTPAATLTTAERLQMPVPEFLRGKIVFTSDRFGAPTFLVMQPDGTLDQVLTGVENFNIVFARESYSPDRTRQAVVNADPNGILQIWILDLATDTLTPVTTFAKGVSYDAVWSPDGGRIAFVSTETGGDELYVFDLATRQITRITNSADLGLPLNKRPSWSPDGQEIVFMSSRSGQDQIWIINADGSELRRISQGNFKDYDPVWVK